jgi:hypothetical protein
MLRSTGCGLSFLASNQKVTGKPTGYLKGPTSILKSLNWNDQEHRHSLEDRKTLQDQGQEENQPGIFNKPVLPKKKVERQF